MSSRKGVSKKDITAAMQENMVDIWLKLYPIWVKELEQGSLSAEVVEALKKQFREALEFLNELHESTGEVFSSEEVMRQLPGNQWAAWQHAFVKNWEEGYYRKYPEKKKEPVGDFFRDKAIRRKNRQDVM